MPRVIPAVSESVPDVDVLLAAAVQGIGGAERPGQVQMAEAVRHVRSAFGAAPLCIGVHALFAPQARDLLLDAGASRVLSCNTVPDASNAVDVLPDIAAAVRPLLQAGV